MAPERGLYESPYKIGLGEPKKSPYKDPLCRNRPPRGISGVLMLAADLSSEGHLLSKRGSKRGSKVTGRSITDDHTGPNKGNYCLRISQIYSYIPCGSVLVLTINRTHAMWPIVNGVRKTGYGHSTGLTI